jgi:hypothetical protein
MHWLGSSGSKGLEDTLFDLVGRGKQDRELVAQSTRTQGVDLDGPRDRASCIRLGDESPMGAGLWAVACPLCRSRSSLGPHKGSLRHTCHSLVSAAAEGVGRGS